MITKAHLMVFAMAMAAADQTEAQLWNTHPFEQNIDFLIVFKVIPKITPTLPFCLPLILDADSEPLRSWLE
jgi:hypothetical protein